MPRCEKLDKCPFFSDRMANMPAVADLMKREYCLGDKEACARYQVSNAGIPVPGDLFPADSVRARQLIGSR